MARLHHHITSYEHFTLCRFCLRLQTSHCSALQLRYYDGQEARQYCAFGYAARRGVGTVMHSIRGSVCRQCCALLCISSLLQVVGGVTVQEARQTSQTSHAIQVWLNLHRPEHCCFLHCSLIVCNTHTRETKQGNLLLLQRDLRQWYK